MSNNHLLTSLNVKGHVNEYPTMHYFGIPWHTQSMIAYDFDWVFLEIPVRNCIAEMLLTCSIIKISTKGDHPLIINFNILYVAL